MCEVERLETELREDKTVLERRCGEGEVTVRTLHDQVSLAAIPHGSHR